MEVTGFTSDGAIRAIVGGVDYVIPDDISNPLRQDIARWEAAGNTIPAYNPYPLELSAAKAQKLAELDDYRWQREVGGISLVDLTIRTDPNSQAKIAAAYTMAKLDPGYSVSTWEVVPGMFLSLGNSDLVMMGEAVRDHVQATFDRKAELHALIAALDSVEAVAAFDIAAQW